MRLTKVQDKSKILQVKNALMEYSRHFRFSVVMDSNTSSNEENGFDSYDLIAAFSHFGEVVGENVAKQVEKLWDKKKEWRFLSLTYDFKNEIENLTSQNEDRQEFPLLSWFSPQVLLLVKEGKSTLFVDNEASLNLVKSEVELSEEVETRFESSLSKQDYISHVNKVKEHILRGDIYEMNYCLEFFIDNIKLQPELLWQESLLAADTPFSTYYKCDHHYLISGSPERFIKKSGNKLISQPIKGTVARGRDSEEDNRNRAFLKANLKERNENVMIVDLVRNDLSKIAVDGSVSVEELYGVYAFSKVFHMISSISCELRDDTALMTILQALFPMGSMTGAPKIKAMELIELYEEFKRGIYSGTIGYIDPEDNFDFNVVIRSLVYNSKKDYLSYAVGGAITKMSDPDLEWIECRLKASTMETILSNYARRVKGLL